MQFCLVYSTSGSTAPSDPSGMSESAAIFEFSVFGLERVNAAVEVALNRQKGVGGLWNVAKSCPSTERCQCRRNAARIRVAIASSLSWRVETEAGQARKEDGFWDQGWWLPWNDAEIVMGKILEVEDGAALFVLA
jgi:hypothetical protein